MDWAGEVLVLHLKEYRESPNKLAHRLPWAMIIAPGVVINKTGSFQSTIIFNGPDLYSSTEEELDAVAAQVNNALMRLPSPWAYFIEVQRRKYNYYPNSEFPNPASNLVDEERKRIFLDNGHHFTSTYYLTFTYMSPSEQSQRILNKFMDQQKIDYTKHLEYFQDEVRKIVDILKTIFPYVEYLDDDATLTYLHSCISTKYHPVKTPKTPVFLDYLLPDELLIGGFQPKLGESFLKVISIDGFPLESDPQILKDLDGLGCEYRWSTRFICLSKNEAIRELKKYSKQWFSKKRSLWSLVKMSFMNEIDDGKEDTDAVNKSYDCDAVAEMVAGGLVSAGYYTSCIVLWDMDLDALHDKVSSVEQITNSAGFVTRNESLNVIQSWLGSLPGHCWANIRRPLVHSLNLTHLIPLSSDWAGPEMNKHLNGPPLFYAKTLSNTPFRYSTHVGDVGHTMIVGPTGAGKSALLSFMAVQFQRYRNAQVYIFDKDKSARITTLLTEGDHYDLGENIDLAFQPLMNIDKESERSWALEWVTEILAQQNVVVTPSLRNELWEALTNLSTSPIRQRTITGLVTLVQNKEIREALFLYTLQGSYGQLLDAESDTLEYGRFQCFEMNHLMVSMHNAVPPVLSYLFHRLDQRFTGDPTLLLLDESWLFLDHPIFSNKIRDWLKTLRKANVAVVFSTQSVADMVKSPIFSTLNESCPTRIFLPNRKAFEPEAYEQYQRFGLNHRQIEILVNAMPKRQYYCQSDAGNRLFDLGLDPVSLAICASSSKDDHKLMDALLEEGKNDLLNKWLNLKSGTKEVLQCARATS
jgi:type IV secretion system protein VirB4